MSRISVFINLSNQRSPGPRQLALNFVNVIIAYDNKNTKYIIAFPAELIKSEWMQIQHIEFIPIKKMESPFNYFYRLYIDFIKLPKLILKNKCTSALFFGNYAPVRIPKIRKVVLLHHPYLVDDLLLQSSPIYVRAVEKIKRYIFKLTIKSECLIVVQSEYMKSKLREKYNIDRNLIKIIPNPVSSSFLGVLNNERNKVPSFKLIYPSRFYPHKNHEFLLDIARTLKKRQFKPKLQFIITVNTYSTDSKAREFLESVSEEKLSDIILNIGEVSQEKLVDYYKAADALIFPSNSETFGNPLMEAMRFGLPVIVPRLEYARAICNDVALYYEHNNVEGLIKVLERFYSDSNLRSELAASSLKRGAIFPTPTAWVNKYLNLISNGTCNLPIPLCQDMR